MQMFAVETQVNPFLCKSRHHVKLNKFSLFKLPGGGFYVQSNGMWSIQGIVSASYLATGSKCNLKQYAVFTKVSSFLSWISLVIKQDDSEVLNPFPVSMDCELEK